MSIDRKDRILELDALRGFAALFVVFFHLTMGKEQAQSGFRYGVTGVDLFFMISGFVIFLTLSRISHWKEFVISRVARLYPTYWVAVTFTFILLLLNNLYLSEDNLPLIKKYLANMTMLQYYMLIPDLDGPYWTMIVELVFYIFMLVIYRAGWLKRIELIGFLILLFTLLHETLIHAYFPFVHKLIGLACPLINHFPLFFAGILFYRLRNEEQTWFTWFLLVACFPVQLMLLDNGGNSHAFIDVREYSVILLIYFSLFALFVSGNLKWLVNPVTLFLGAISYPLYLIHQTMSIQFIMPFLTKDLGLGFWISALITALTAIGAAAILMRGVDKGLAKRFKAMLKRKMLPEKTITGQGS